jgi:hypothetical protein
MKGECGFTSIKIKFEYEPGTGIYTLSGKGLKKYTTSAEGI